VPDGHSDSDGEEPVTGRSALLGGGHERRAINAVVEGSRTGVSRALVLGGEGGVRKSDLLRLVGAAPNLVGPT
jgi:hypothetical protein